MTAIVDYGAGNIFSVKNALDYLGLDYKLTGSAEDIEAADRIILPGVGAFPSAMKSLAQTGLIDTLREQAKVKPFLGICLGMQMLFDKGYEFEECDGLKLIKGEVSRIESDTLVVPHMGWNRLEYLHDCPLLNGLEKEEYVYFVHSYKAFCSDDNISAWSDYDGKVPALVTDGAYVFGTQFHPEKSGRAGLRILQNFGGLK